MSTMSAFRKIDIDQYNTDRFDGDEPSSLDGPSTPSGVDENEIKRLIQGNKKGDALKNLLASAPLSSKNQATKDKATDLMMQVMMSIKSSEIDKAIENLDVDMTDVLMKYIYRGFEIPSDGSSGHLLVWHEKVFALGGVGSIVRVLTDKKKV